MEESKQHQLHLNDTKQKLLEKDKLFQTKINEMQSQINKLMEDNKEMEIENNSLKIQNKELKLKVINNGNYNEWNIDDIISWILSLDDGRFIKYENILNINLREQGIDGSHLSEINELDVQGFGITNFSDKKYLTQRIKDLVEKNNQIEIDKEGVTANVDAAQTAYMH